ncbi:MAG: biotin/lipoyl-containing protein [Bacteroidota bacterium]
MDKESVGYERLSIQGTVYETTLSKKFRERTSWVPQDPRKILCYIPGLIQRLHVRSGSLVRRGDPLLVLEAMKMQNDIVAPMDGKVKSVHVRAGDRVTKGTVLIELE